MKITLKTAGLLGRYLPPGSAANFADLDVAQGATPTDVIKQLGMPLDGRYLIVVNGTSIPQGERSSRVLAESDSLVIMPPLKGG